MATNYLMDWMAARLDELEMRRSFVGSLPPKDRMNQSQKQVVRTS